MDNWELRGFQAVTCVSINLFAASTTTSFMFYFFVLNAEWWIFVWIVLTSRNPQIRNLQQTFHLIFHFQTCIQHPTNAECERVCICVNFNQPESRILQCAECELRSSYYFRLVCVFPQPASHKMRNAQCRANWIKFVLFLRCRIP